MKKIKFEEKKFSYKDAKPGKINVKAFKEAVYLLLEADDWLYKKAPNHYLNENEAKEFCKIIIKSINKLNEVLEEFGYKVEKKKEMEKSALYIVTNKKLFRKLKSLGYRVVSTDGYLDINDYKGRVPENALKGLEKKINIVKENIKKQIQKIKPSKIYVVVADEEDLKVYKKAKELYNAEKVDIDDFE